MEDISDYSEFEEYVDEFSDDEEISKFEVHFPADLLLHVLMFYPIEISKMSFDPSKKRTRACFHESIMKISLVSRYWRLIMCTDVLWEFFFREKWPYIRPMFRKLTRSKKFEELRREKNLLKLRGLHIEYGLYSAKWCFIRRFKFEKEEVVSVLKAKKKIMINSFLQQGNHVLLGSNCSKIFFFSNIRTSRKYQQHNVSKYASAPRICGQIEVYNRQGRKYLCVVGNPFRIVVYAYPEMTVVAKKKDHRICTAGHYRCVKAYKGFLVTGGYQKVRYHSIKTQLRSGGRKQKVIITQNDLSITCLPRAILCMQLEGDTLFVGGEAGALSRLDLEKRSVEQSTRLSFLEIAGIIEPLKTCIYNMAVVQNQLVICAGNLVLLLDKTDFAVVLHSLVIHNPSVCIHNFCLFGEPSQGLESRILCGTQSGLCLVQREEGSGEFKLVWEKDDVWEDENHVLGMTLFRRKLYVGSTRRGFSIFTFSERRKRRGKGKLNRGGK